MSAELKPCPFCGGRAQLCGKQHDGDWWWVQCTCCTLCTADYELKKFPVNIWNRRTVDVRTQNLRALINEINCRWEHGADGKGHLQYIEKELRKIVEGD